MTACSSLKFRTSNPRKVVLLSTSLILLCGHGSSAEFWFLWLNDIITYLVFSCFNKIHQTFEEIWYIWLLNGLFVVFGGTKIVLVWLILCLYFTLEETFFDFIVYLICVLVYLKMLKIKWMLLDKRSTLGGIPFSFQHKIPCQLPPASNKKRIDCRNCSFLASCYLEKVSLLLSKFFIWRSSHDELQMQPSHMERRQTIYICA